MYNQSFIYVCIPVYCTVDVNDPVDGTDDIAELFTITWFENPVYKSFKNSIISASTLKPKTDFISAGAEGVVKDAEL